jgi:hypothetical protein
MRNIEVVGRDSVEPAFSFQSSLCFAIYGSPPDAQIAATPSLANPLCLFSVQTVRKQSLADREK